MSTAIYPGSFDPLTHGHVSIIRSSLVAFDHLIVPVLTNPKKQTLFTVKERMDMISKALEGIGSVEVDAFEGLTVDYAKRRGAKILVRGLRAVADFEYELQMANMNRHLNREVETVFIMANDALSYVSSSLVKEVAALGGDVSGLVPPVVADALKKKLRK